MKEKFELIQETQTRYRIFVMSKSFTGVEGWIYTKSRYANVIPDAPVKLKFQTTKQVRFCATLSEAIERIQVRHPELSIKNLNKNAA